jgi:hypothetical protein
MRSPKPNCARNSAHGRQQMASLFHDLLFCNSVMATTLRMRKLTLLLLCLIQSIAQCLAPFAAVSVLDIGRAHAESGASSSVVINEIHYDPRSKAAGEFVELYNAGPSAVNLTGWLHFSARNAAAAGWLRRRSTQSGSVAPTVRCKCAGPVRRQIVQRRR